MANSDNGARKIRPQITQPENYRSSNPRGKHRMTKRQSELHRTSIDISKTVKALQDHRDGKTKLNTSQIRACEILLDRSLPKLTATEIEANITDERTETMSDAELVAIAGGKAG